MSSKSLAAERVARGAALLDLKRPGWADRIDLERLDLAQGDRCVVGQVYRAEAEDRWLRRNPFPMLTDGARRWLVGPYGYGTGELFHGRDDQSDVEHGFDVDEGYDPEESGWLLDELDEAWREAVAARRGDD